MKTHVLLVAILFAACIRPQYMHAQTPSTGQGQKALYQQAKQEIEHMLAGKTPLNFERAIYLTENAWWNGHISYSDFRKAIEYGTKNIQIIAARNVGKQPEQQTGQNNFWAALDEKNRADKGYLERARLNAAIYKYMTDTNLFIDKSSMFIHYPYHYAIADPLGSNDWTNTQVSHLLQTHVGNCFAFVSLFKMYAERLYSDADICTAPGHVYITHKDEKGTQYNVEVASRAFPGTGTLSTLTHTTQTAIENDISLRQLNLKQSVALSLVYLAKGYEHTFKTTDSFLVDCAALALQYDSLNLNAMLLQAEVLESNFIKDGKSVAQLQTTPAFKTYQQLLTKLYILGYREMPLAMKNLLVKGLMRDSVTRLAMKNYAPKPVVGNSTVSPIRYASLSWGLFEEQITDKPLEQYGRTMYNTKQHRITGFTKEQQLYNHYDFDPVVFAWNVDPLAHQFPSQSPYSAFNNNPIFFVDPDGRSGVAFWETSGNTKTLVIKADYHYIAGAINAETIHGVQSEYGKFKKMDFGGERVNVRFEIGFISETAGTDLKQYDGSNGQNRFVAGTAERPGDLEESNREEVLVDYAAIRNFTAIHADDPKKEVLRFSNSDIREQTVSSISHGIGHNLGLLHADGGIMQHQRTVIGGNKMEFNGNTITSYYLNAVPNHVTKSNVQNLLDRIPDMSKEGSGYWNGKANSDGTGIGITTMQPTK